MSIADLEQWAGTRSPNLGEPAAAAEPLPLTTPSQPAETPEPLPLDRVQPASGNGGSPAAGTHRDRPDPKRPWSPPPRICPLTRLTCQSSSAGRLVQKRTVGERDLHMIHLDRGTKDGIEKGNRLRVQRGGEQVVLLSVFNVLEDRAVAIVLDGTWGENQSEEVREGDLVVRDR